MFAILLTLVTSANQIVMGRFKKYNVMISISDVNAQQLLAFYAKKYDMLKLKMGISYHGELSDCYIPRRKTILLSSSTYNNKSVAALAVVSHEFGHAMQHKKHSFLYIMHRFVSFSSRVLGVLVLPATIVGLILLLPFLLPHIAVWILTGAAGIIFLGLLGRLLTISVEYDASARAKKLLSENNVLQEHELKFVDKVLSAAGFTYIASFINTILGITFLKRIIYGGKKKKR